MMISCMAALLSSCSKIKELDGRTQNMDDNTQKMSKTTENMAETTGGMKATTTTMYNQVRAKEAEETRHRSFDAVENENNQMGTKISNAAVYFMSFEFQLWTGTSSYDDQKFREDLFLDATNEFTRRMNDLYAHVNTKKMGPTNEGKSYNAEESFYALSAALHMNHRYQEQLHAKHPEIEIVSFYDIMKVALTKDFNHDSNILAHEEILLTGINKEVAVELLKARVDILSALSVKHLTDKREMTLSQKIAALLFKVTGGSKGTIALPETYANANNSTKNTVETYLDGALKTKVFLKTIGIEKKVEKTIYSVLQNIKLVDKTKIESDAKALKIKSLIDSLLK